MVLGRTPLIVDAEMRVLVINSGSSSIKFRLVDLVEESTGGLAVRPAVRQGTVKGIGSTASFELIDGQTHRSTNSVEVRDHAQALRVIFDGLADTLGGIEAVGHRVVHGGERYRESVLITDQVEADIDALSELAPLHNPPSLAAIRGTRKMVGASVPMVAVFDTAFHHSMPRVARHYALPSELADRYRIQRYGFHGIAHASLAHGYSAHTGRPLEETRLITMQLGNGCSITAIAQGRSVETSMGFTPLEGLVMGTRSGDVDASVVGYLAERERVSASEVDTWLNERSGLLGLSGRTQDMRELLRVSREEQDPGAELAVALFCYRLRKYLGAYLVVLGGADAIIFGGGIGENAPVIRERICEKMEWYGLTLDHERNRAATGLAPGLAAAITSEGSRPSAYVVAADEETWIAKETVRCVQTGQS